MKPLCEETEEESARTDMAFKIRAGKHTSD